MSDTCPFSGMTIKEVNDFFFLDDGGNLRWGYFVPGNALDVMYTTKRGRTRAMNRSGSLVTLHNTSNGYLYVAFRVPKQKNYLVHRLVYALTRHEWPDRVDHINGVRTDNRPSNLRSVTAQGNAKNMGFHKTERNPHVGVMRVAYMSKINPWLAQIGVNGKPKYLGLHPTKSAA